MAIDSTSTTTQKIAEVSQYLSANEASSKSMLNWGYTKGVGSLSETLEIVQTTLNWARTYYSSTTKFALCCNYMVSLIGKYYTNAYGIVTSYINSGMIVNPATGNASSVLAFNLEFIVGIGGMTQGQTTYTINYPYIVQDSISVSTPSANIPLGDPSQLSYNVSYTDKSATVTFLNGTPNIGVQNGMQFIIRGLRFISANYTGGASIPTPAFAWYTVPTSGLTTITVPVILNKEVQIVFRGGFAGGQIILSGIPTSNQILSNATLGTLTVAAGNEWLENEQIVIQYIS
jgi:hypothetical protein